MRNKPRHTVARNASQPPIAGSAAYIALAYQPTLCCTQLIRHQHIPKLYSRLKGGRVKNPELNRTDSYKDTRAHIASGRTAVRSTVLAGTSKLTVVACVNTRYGPITVPRPRYCDPSQLINKLLIAVPGSTWAVPPRRWTRPRTRPALPTGGTSPRAPRASAWSSRTRQWAGRPRSSARCGRRTPAAEAVPRPPRGAARRSGPRARRTAARRVHAAGRRRGPLAAPPSAARAPPARGTAMLRGAAVDIKYRPPRRAPVGGKWTEEEDRRLREIVETFGAKNWKRLAMLLGTVRSDVQCLHRWNKVLRPGLSKGPWAAVWKPTGESASQTQLRRRRRVDGVKRLEFEIHTGGRRPRTASSATWCCATARGTSSGA